jgi:hypothetical protein
MRVGQSCPHRCAIGWYIWQRPSRSAAYDAAGNGAWGAMSQFRNISLTGRDRRRYSGCGTQKKTTGGPTSGCGAKPSRRCRTELGWEGKSAPRSAGDACRARWPLLAMLHWAGESRCCGGRSEMANRLPVLAACFLSAFLMAGLTAADAADPGFCRQYAQAALKQVRGALSNPRCGGGLQGARWSADFPVHYEWCLGADYGAAGAERDARTRYLRACTGR